MAQLEPETCKMCMTLMKQWLTVKTMRDNGTWDKEKLNRRQELLNARTRAHLEEKRLAKQWLTTTQVS